MHTEARDPMKKMGIAVLLLLSALAWGRDNPNPAEYTVNIHVSASRTVIENGYTGYLQRLNVVIDGKKYELRGNAGGVLLLALGDYKARIITDEQKGTYDSFKIYEFIFPDQKTRKFTVVGMTE
jgi:hypothetical protein